MRLEGMFFYSESSQIEW